MVKLSIGIKRRCEVCGKVFIAKQVGSRYCSHNCSAKASAKRKALAKEKARMDAIAERISDKREFISVREAVAVYGVCRDTLYKLIRLGKIEAINPGTRLTRVKRSDLEGSFQKRKELRVEEEKPVPKLYSMEPKDCYTIGQIEKKYHLDESTIWMHIRKNAIPMRQIGNYVYVPKVEIDNLYKSDIK